MNIKQITWAKSHDWFIESIELVAKEGHQANYLVVVKDDLIAGKQQNFESFKNLHTWAGY